MNKYDRQHLKNLSGYEGEVSRLYDRIYRDIGRLAPYLPEIAPNAEFNLKDYPMLHAKIEAMMARYQMELEAIIVNGIEQEWTLSNNKNNELSRWVFGANVGRLTESQYRRYFNNNESAMKAFIQRRDSVTGLDLSERVWRYRKTFKNEIEAALEVGIKTGIPAESMATEMKQFLQNPFALYRRVRDENGDLQLSKAARLYHPGQGVYRSSFKNARRLAATETNIAYRTEDYNRWQQMDFVVGVKIQLSNNHTTHNSKGQIVPLYDICDILQGRYPKDFKFVGWHPHCRCIATSILKTEEEIDADTQKILRGEKPDGESVNAVKDVPESFRGWVERNGGRIAAAKKLPYFISDNAEKYLPGVRFTKAAKVQMREAGKDAVYDRERIKFRRNQIKEAAKSLRDEDPISHRESRISITITGSGIDEFLNQPHKHYAEKNEMLLNIRSVIENSKYMGVSTHKGKVAHIFETELCGEKTWIIATDIKGRGISLHSISDSDRVLVGIKKTT